MSLKTIGLSISLGLATGAFDLAVGKSIGKINLVQNALEKLKNKRINLKQNFKSGTGAVLKLQNELRKIDKQIGAINNHKLKIQASLDKRAEFKNNLVDKIALGAAIIAPIKIGIDYESAMADVKKVVNFKDNEELANFSNQIVKLSSKIPLNANELATIVASGGQLGIAKEKLLDFTTITAKMSTAFDMLPSEAGEASAKLMNIFALDIKEVSSLGDAINHLSDNTASKARDIVNVLARVGGSAKVFGLSAKQTSSLASAFLSLGKPAEVTGTAINALLLKLGTADNQGAKFKNALSKMGIDTQSLKQNIKENGQSAIYDFLKAINTIPKDEQMSVLADLFGAEYSDDIALLASGIDNYKKIN